jgi:hypothetical protein
MNIRILIKKNIKINNRIVTLMIKLKVKIFFMNTNVNKVRKYLKISNKTTMIVNYYKKTITKIRIVKRKDISIVRNLVHRKVTLSY